MDFYNVIDVVPYDPTYAKNPFAGRRKNGEWEEGLVSVDHLNRKFGDYETAEEMKKHTDSEGYKKYFDWLAEKGKIPKD